MPIGGKIAFLSKVTFRRESNWVSKTKQMLKGMKTIEERAKVFAQEEKYIDCIGCDSCSKCKEYNTYVDIATEQQKIDEEEQGKALLYAVHKTAERTKKEVIDKACEWLLSQNLISRCIVDDEAFVKRFRKSMEE